MEWPIRIDWGCKIIKDLDSLGISMSIYRLVLINEGFKPPIENTNLWMSSDWWRWGN